MRKGEKEQVCVFVLKELRCSSCRRGRVREFAGLSLRGRADVEQVCERDEGVYRDGVVVKRRVD